MGCGCKERREAIKRGVRYVSSGKIGDGGRELKVVVESAARDVASAFRVTVDQIKGRLRK